MIKGDEKNHERLDRDIGMIVHLKEGQDGVIRSTKVKCNKSILERAVQHLYPMELSCEQPKNKTQELNPHANEYWPKCASAEAAKYRISEVTEYENELPIVK